jgi:hypothetical protein
MDLEPYRWQDHVIRSDWWTVELGVTLLAFAALIVASLNEEPSERDFHRIDIVGVSIPAVPEPHADAPGDVASEIESTATTRPLIRSAQPRAEHKCEGRSVGRETRIRSSSRWRLA